MRHRWAAVVACATGLLVVPVVVAGQAEHHPARVGTPGEAAVAAPPAAAAAGFSDAVVGRVASPTRLVWTPDGRMLVISKPGRLFVVEPGVPNQLALDTSRRVCSEKELGLVGITVDPAFETNHFVYLYYTRRGGGTCTTDGGSNLANRVGRFVLQDDNTIERASERVIVDHIEAPRAHHVAGDLEFGADGYLYISVGDGVCTVVGPLRCGPLNTNSQKRRVPQGKILRVGRWGVPARTNPYVGIRGARRCTGPDGVPRGKGPCKEIFALGFRNPFWFARPTSGSTDDVTCSGGGPTGSHGDTTSCRHASGRGMSRSTAAGEQLRWL